MFAAEVNHDIDADELQRNRLVEVEQAPGMTVADGSDDILTPQGRNVAAPRGCGKNSNTSLVLMRSFAPRKQRDRCRRYRHDGVPYKKSIGDGRRGRSKRT